MKWTHLSSRITRHKWIKEYKNYDQKYEEETKWEGTINENITLLNYPFCIQIPAQFHSMICQFLIEDHYLTMIIAFVSLNCYCDIHFSFQQQRVLAVFPVSTFSLFLVLETFAAVAAESMKTPSSFYRVKFDFGLLQFCYLFSFSHEAALHNIQSSRSFGYPFFGNRLFLQLIFTHMYNKRWSEIMKNKQILW